ncbi:response regulator [Candidatus Fermentibacteria bacterium]|nr:response regulator [Candidatus Fermentibacteria bacterium]
MTILIVDDNEQNLYQLQVLLGGNGYEVVAAPNGAEALAKGRQNPPDLIISDILMPVMDGFALCRKWNQDERLRSVPFIFYTATYTDGRDREFALGLGAARFIVKPVEPEVFIQTIQEVIQQVQHPASGATRERIEAPPGDEAGYLKQYNATLIRKLEAKMQQLEQTNRELELSLADHRHMEHDLEASETRYRRLFEAAKDGILILDADTGMIVDVNPFLVELVGCSRNEFLGRHLWEIGLFRNIVASKASFAELQDKGYVRHEDLPLATRDGREIDVEFVSNVYRVDNQRVIQCNVRDITERRQAEKALRQSEDLLNEVGRIAKIGGWKMDLITRKAAWTRGTYDIVEIEPGQPIPGPDEHVDYYLPEYRPMIAEAMRALIEDDKPLDFEAQLRTAKGNIKWCRAQARALREGETTVEVRGTFQDITARKQAEEALRASEAQLSNALQIARAGHWEYDVGRDLFTFNDNFYRVFRTAASEVGGYQMSSADYARRFCHPDDAAIVAQEVRAAIESADPDYSRQIEHRSLRADGEVGYITVRFFIVKDPQGRTVKTYGVNQDITERKKAEEERAKLQAQLQQAQKMEFVGRLAGGVAHDFNNQLQVIFGYTTFAQKRVDPGDLLYGDLEEIRKAAQRSADLTRQLLAFARKQTIAPEVLDVNAAVESTLKMLRRLIGESIDLAWLPGKNLWQVKVDPAQIDQILANLCVNARDAIEGVGKVTIETGTAQFDEISCSEHAGCVPGEYVVLAVSDNGCGMEPAVLEHLFEPFFTTKGVGEGTGLGLATVHGIVTQNKGFVSVRSEPGEGTIFRIYLPRHEGEAVDAWKEKAKEVPKGRGETVLVVEDELSILRLARRMLESLGYVVLTAGTPSEAAGLASHHTGEIHLLITDVVMPEMTGRDLAARIAETRPELRCLYMSGYTADVIAPFGLLEDGVQFMQKPFTLEELARKVREALEG